MTLHTIQINGRLHVFKNRKGCENLIQQGGKYATIETSKPKALFQKLDMKNRWPKNLDIKQFAKND